MKRILIVIFILFSTNGFSQSSFRVQVDTAIKFRQFTWVSPEIISCTDGGIAIAGITDQDNGVFGGISFILRVDSNGVMQWFNKYITASDDFSGLQIIAASEGSLYMNSQPDDFMFSQFAYPVIQKIDKFGIVHGTSQPGTSFSFIEGHYLKLSAVEKYTDNLYGGGSHYTYDPIEDEPCCYEGFSFKCDSNFNILRKNNRDFLLYDTLDVPFHAFNTAGFDNESFGIGICDTSGIQSSIHYYSYDTTLINSPHTFQIVQDANYYYMLDIGNSSPWNKIAVHKVDKNWNSIYLTVIDSIDASPYIAINRKPKIGIKGNGGIFLSALFMHNNSFFGRKPLMLEIDSLGTIFNSWSSLDSMYFDNDIDTISGSALFLRSTDVNFSNSNAEFQKAYFSSPGCGMVPANIISSQIAIIDSSNSDTLTFNQSYYPFFNNLSFSLTPTIVPILTTLCGPLSLPKPNIQNKCAITIFPNPSATSLNLSSGCRFKENSEMTIYNIMGGEVLRGQIDNESQEIHLKINNLPSGIYFIKGHFADGGVFNEKIVVQK